MAIKKTTHQIETLDEYYSFMDSRIRALESRVSNCFGTGLFCTGEIDSDEYCHGEKPDDILSGLERISAPEKGMLVAWHTSRKMSHPYHYHLAVIVDIDSLLITHRTGWCGPVIQKQPLDEIEYPRYLRRRYLIPKLMESLL